MAQPESSASAETYPVIERGKTPEVGPEVKDWLTKVEQGEDIELPQPVTDDQGQPLVSSSAPQSVNLVLPLTDDEIKMGLKATLVDSLRWLTEWCLRLIKLTPNKFNYFRNGNRSR